MHYVPALDGVRAIAVAGVFLLHLAIAYVPGGAFGVDVFFVLSAFLITGLLLQEYETTGRIRLGEFYWRRVFRLAPALFLWLVVASVTATLAHQTDKVAWSVAGALFYFLDFLEAWTDHVAAAFDQAWSLAVEEQFYLIWPALLLFVLFRFSPRVQRYFLGASVVAATALALSNPNYFLPTGHLLPLVLGCWAAEQSSRDCSPWVRYIARVPFIGLAALAVFALAAVGETRLHVDTALTIAVDFAAVVLVLSIVQNENASVNRLLASRVPRWVGARSYGIYLYGLTLMQLVPLLTGLRLTYAAPVDIVATSIVAALSYRFVESPIRARGRQWLESRRVRREKVR